jgi:hypothetical protein
MLAAALVAARFVVAAERRRPTKPIPTNCDAKEGRWCYAGFPSTAGTGASLMSWRSQVASGSLVKTNATVCTRFPEPAGTIVIDTPNTIRARNRVAAGML